MHREEINEAAGNYAVKNWEWLYDNLNEGAIKLRLKEAVVYGANYVLNQQHIGTSASEMGVTQDEFKGLTEKGDCFPV